MTETTETLQTLTEQGYIVNTHLGYLWMACGHCKKYTYNYYLSLSSKEQRKVVRGGMPYKPTHRTICEVCNKENK